MPPQPSSPLCRRVRLEHQIESEYRTSLQQQCYNERMLQQRPALAITGKAATTQAAKPLAATLVAATR